MNQVASTKAIAEITEPPTASTRLIEDSWLRGRIREPITQPARLPTAPPINTVPMASAIAPLGLEASVATRGASRTPATTPTARPIKPITCRVAPRRYPESRESTRSATSITSSQLTRQVSSHGPSRPEVRSGQT